jgi:cytochrome c oxidase subunit 3
LHAEAQATWDSKSKALRTPGRSHFSISPAVVSDTSTAETGMWVVVAAISMSFAAFTSSMIVRQGASADWLDFQLPRVLYANTLILLGSSLTLELTRRRIIAAIAIPATLRHSSADARTLLSNGIYWLYVTGALGLIFILGQFLAWRNLVAQGLYLATNPSSSFFYVFTALHGVHLLGGIAGLAYLLRKLTRSKTDSAMHVRSFGAFSIYWHFMDILWVYLLLLLAMRM